MDSNIEGDTLAKRYPFLSEDAEDIAYRMYDLFMRHHPKLGSRFKGSRDFHIQLLQSLINSQADFDSNCNKISSKKQELPSPVYNHPLLIKHPNLLHLNRRCLVNALQDVLFGDANEKFLHECKAVFDELCTKARETPSKAQAHNH